MLTTPRETATGVIVYGTAPSSKKPYELGTEVRSALWNTQGRQTTAAATTPPPPFEPRHEFIDIAPHHGRSGS